MSDFEVDAAFDVVDRAEFLRPHQRAVADHGGHEHFDAITGPHHALERI